MPKARRSSVRATRWWVRLLHGRKISADGVVLRRLRTLPPGATRWIERPGSQRYFSNTSWNILIAAFHDSLSAFAS